MKTAVKKLKCYQCKVPISNINVWVSFKGYERAHCGQGCAQKTIARKEAQRLAQCARCKYLINKSRCAMHPDKILIAEGWLSICRAAGWNTAGSAAAHKVGMKAHSASTGAWADHLEKV